MLWYVLIEKVIFVIDILIQKKKKKKKKKPVLQYGKKCKSYATKNPLSIFLLGKGGNPYVARPYIKTK